MNLDNEIIIPLKYAKYKYPIHFLVCRADEDQDIGIKKQFELLGKAMGVSSRRARQFADILKTEEEEFTNVNYIDGLLSRFNITKDVFFNTKMKKYNLVSKISTSIRNQKKPTLSH